MSKFALSALAEEDLIQIYTNGAATFGLEMAHLYHQKLYQDFKFLAENPLAAPRRPELTTDVRVHPVGSHIVLYNPYP